MSDFQKLTLKRHGRNFLIVCGLALLCYGMVKFELVSYTVLAILILTIVGGFTWAMIRIVRWDWWLRGKLDKDEYEAYQSCERIFSWMNDKYIPTNEQIVWIAEHTTNSYDTLLSMFNKLTEGH